MIKIYRKTATIKAEQFDGSEEMIKKYHLGFWKGQDTGEIYEYSIPTKEGVLDLNVSDWIATGVNGEHWPIADDVFQKTYAELPVIPRFVADYIRLMKLEGKSLGDAIKYWLREDDIDEYMEDNSETFARAWLDGYQVEAQHDARTD